jgi:ABC-2 type transport system permease protein
MMEGQFTSFFAGKPSPLAKDGVVAEAKDKEAETGDAAANAASQASADNKTAGRRDAKDATDQKPSITSVIERSPESARIILVSSDSFLSDEVLELASSIDRTQYLAPVSFAQNLIDWSLEDRGAGSSPARSSQWRQARRCCGSMSVTLWPSSGLASSISFTAIC